MAREYAPNRIKELRKAAGLSLEQLGLRMSNELTASTVAKLENSKMALSADYLLEIATILGVSPAEVLHADGREVRWVPVIGAVEAGRFGEAITMTDRFAPIPSHFRERNLYGLEPYGTSMDLICPPGGTIIVNPDDTHLRDGKYYVIENGERECTFKRFSAAEMALMPCSSDPSHQPIPVGSEPFKVLGRVVFVGGDL